MAKLMVASFDAHKLPARRLEHPDEGPAVHRVDDVDAAPARQGKPVKGLAPMTARPGELPAWVNLGLLPLMNLGAAFLVSGLPAAEADERRIGLLMAGVTEEAQAA
jgi:hypothetical protein